MHGPPGTGKTSLCKALAQKLAIRFGHRFPQGLLIEVNAHSLFSKWFSESGKLVAKLFAKITEMVEDPECLVFVLIDEVTHPQMTHRDKCLKPLSLLTYISVKLLRRFMEGEAPKMPCLHAHDEVV